jgi:hypothetical protein
VVEFDDQDNAKIAERYSPKGPYEDFLQRKANERELELDGGEAGYQQSRFTENVIHW